VELIMNRIIAVALAIALPLAAHAADNTEQLARGALRAKGIKCEETGLQVVGTRALVTCANGQVYGVERLTVDGKDVLAISRFNQLTNQFDGVQ
jgi:hypothetical protein